MLAMSYRGPKRVRIDQKPIPEILHPQDAIVRVTRSCSCGSDLRLYNGAVPDTRPGMTADSECAGVVEQVGSEVQKLKTGDHVLVPFNIACGKCVFCQQELYGNCHESNPQATAVGGIYGYSHTAGGYNGGQAEYVRVPYADVSPTVIPEGMDPDDAVLLTDVVPTGYQAAEMGGIQTGDTVVVFGAGPVGILAARSAGLVGAGRGVGVGPPVDAPGRGGSRPGRAVVVVGAGPVGILAARSAWLFGAGRVIVIDHLDYRLEFVRDYCPAEVYNFKELDDVVLFMKKTTEGLGADVAIEAVGADAQGNFLHTLLGK